MSSILVIDDMPLFRTSLMASFRKSGYTVFGAKDGLEGLQSIRSNRPDLILLDIRMPKLDGMALLRVMRRDPVMAAIPVILVTEATEKQYVVEAAKLGVRDYLLKSTVTIEELDERVSRLLNAKPATAVATTPSGEAPENRQKPSLASSAARAPAEARSSLPPPVTLEIAPLLTSRQCVQRVEDSMAGKTLSGAVAEVMMLAGRPSAELKDLSALITRDPVLSVRVLQMANSAAFASRRGTVTTIGEAVKNIGATNVRNIAASVGIFDAMPASSADGFNPIRCWQHSFAVARLCEALVGTTSPEEAGTGYLVGLCHDLGEIMFRTQFESEYRSVLAEVQKTGAPVPDVERRLLGMTHAEIVNVILKCMGLPESIRTPIERYHRTARAAAGQPVVLRALAMADNYANGLLLASSTMAAVSPFTKNEWAAISAKTEPQIPDGEEIRGQVYCLTAILSRLDPKEHAELLKSPFKKTESRVWLARDPSFAGADPAALALGELASVELHDRLPTADEAAELACLAIEGRTRNTPGWSAPDIEKCQPADRKLPLLWWILEADAALGTAFVDARHAIPIQTIYDAVRPAA